MLVFLYLAGARGGGGAAVEVAVVHGVETSTDKNVYSRRTMANGAARQPLASLPASLPARLLAPSFTFGMRRTKVKITLESYFDPDAP